MASCAECGASDRDARSCREQWDELLALEFSDVRAGPAHFLTVACYQLQHPAAFRLGEAMLGQLRISLERVVVEGVPVEQVRRDASRSFDGPQRVRDDGTAPPPMLAWSRTVADVGPPDPASHLERVRAWAEAILADLEDHDRCGTDRCDATLHSRRRGEGS